jgi:hypothetical protein
VETVKNMVGPLSKCFAAHVGATNKPGRQLKKCHHFSRLESPFIRKNIFDGKFCLFRPKKLLGTGAFFYSDHVYEREVK